jgi:hypothetical protein
MKPSPIKSIDDFKPGDFFKSTHRAARLIHRVKRTFWYEESPDYKYASPVLMVEDEGGVKHFRPTLRHATMDEVLSGKLCSRCGLSPRFAEELQ